MEDRTQAVESAATGIEFRRHFLAVLRDRQTATQTRKALGELGFDQAVIGLWSSSDVAACAQRLDAQKQKGILDRLRSALAHDERAACEHYLGPLGDDGVLLVVPARGKEQVEAARDVAGRFGASWMRYYGDWTVWDLGHAARRNVDRAQTFTPDQVALVEV